MADLIERTKPTEEGLAVEWTPALRQEVLAGAMTGRSRRLRSGRRSWPLAVAASLVVALTVAGPVAVPGWFANTAAAHELDLVARAAGGQPHLEWTDHQFLRVQTTESQQGEPDAPAPKGEGSRPEPSTGVLNRQVASDDYHTSDGWTWSDRVVNGKIERYIFPPLWGWMRPDYAADMPTEPHLLDAFLRVRALGSTSQDEAVFVAIGDMLRQEAAPPQVRAAAIGVLGLNPKVSVQHTADPLGRPSLKVTFTDAAARSGTRQYLFLAPGTGLLLGEGIDGVGWRYQSVVTNRQVVDALPADLVAALGTDKVGKEVHDGKTWLIPDESGPDPVPVPVPEQTYTPAPKR